jgi:histidyl-tRNA synthetase
LTGSLARIVASNPQLKKPLKLYNIGKAWRYERPQFGRFREFFQSDTDIFGIKSPNAEVELITMICRILNTLKIENYEILINSRKILDMLVEKCNVSADKKADAFRALDKLAKIGVDGVKEEFAQRGLDSGIVDKLKEYFDLSDSNLDKLDRIKETANDDQKKDIEFLQDIVEKTERLVGNGKIRVDFSLVRGLDYYTSTVFEIRSTDLTDMGSFAGGGRYDDLIKLYGGQDTPAAGISLGVERLFEIKKREADGQTRPGTKLMVCYTEGMADKAFAVSEQFRNNGIPTIIALNERSLTKQLDYADTLGVEYCYIILSESEAKLKDMLKKDEKDCDISEAIKSIR